MFLRLTGVSHPLLGHWECDRRTSEETIEHHASSRKYKRKRSDGSPCAARAGGDCEATVSAFNVPLLFFSFSPFPFDAYRSPVLTNVSIPLPRPSRISFTLRDDGKQTHAQTSLHRGGCRLDSSSSPLRDVISLPRKRNLPIIDPVVDLDLGRRESTCHARRNFASRSV